MNEYSFMIAMKLSEQQQDDRRNRVLEGALRCFARDGFHRTTMQAIAAETRISPGALYLYFRSKEDLIVGIVERHRDALLEDFAAAERAPDILAALREIGRRRLVEADSSEMQLAVTIWSEAVRTPAIGTICQSLERSTRLSLRRIFELARTRGIAAATLEPDFAAEYFQTMLQGMLKRRALEPGFTGAMAAGLARATLAALFRGAIHPVMPLASPEKQ